MLKIAHVSDTHNHTPELPDADLLIHSGDLTVHGFRVEFYRQLGWLEANRHRYKYGIIVVPGNHDMYPEKYPEGARTACEYVGVTLLHNASVVIQGVKIYGSGHSPMYHNWGFMLEPEEIRKAWGDIPLDTDVLVTHTPLAGILDKSYRGHIGCPELTQWLNEARKLGLKLQAHCCGHAHSGYGHLRVESDTPCDFFNSAAGAPQVFSVLDETDKLKARVKVLEDAIKSPCLNQCSDCYKKLREVLNG